MKAIAGPAGEHFKQRRGTDQTSPGSVFVAGITTLLRHQRGIKIACEGWLDQLTGTTERSSQCVHRWRFYSIGFNPASICARRGSRNGGNASFWPSVSIGSSVANPGPSVAISNRMPLGSRKYRLRK